MFPLFLFCVLTLITLGINVTSLLLIALALLFTLVVRRIIRRRRPRGRRHLLHACKTVLTAIWKRMRPLARSRSRCCVLLWSTWREHRRMWHKAQITQPKPEQRETQVILLLEDIRRFGTDLEDLEQTWSKERHAFYTRNHLAVPPCTPSGPHLPFSYEFLALERSLTHLGTPTDDARLTSEDLDFYRDWITGLHQHLTTFQHHTIQQHQRVKSALEEVKQVHITLGMTDQRLTHGAAYWHAEGVLGTLDYLLGDGCVPAEALLPLIEAHQRHQQRLFAPSASRV